MGFLKSEWVGAILTRIVLPILLSVFFFYEQGPIILEHIRTLNTDWLVVDYLQIFFFLIVTPTVCLVDILSGFLRSDTSVGSSAWQIRFFANSLYLVLLGVSVIQLLMRI